MAAGSLDLSDLGRLVAAERNRRGMSLRETADAVGIPFNTLARVEKGHVPDLPKFKRLVEWCGADIAEFFEPHEKAAVTTDVIAEHLRSDRNLPPDAADRIAGIVTELYEALARPERGRGGAPEGSEDIQARRCSRPRGTGRRSTRGALGGILGWRFVGGSSQRRRGSRRARERTSG